MTPFHAYCHARTLENLSDEEKLLPVYASSDIQVYPYQIAAAGFALRSPWQKGAILCDEAGMGKSHEAALIMAQRYLEGYDRILLCIPNADLLSQWTDLIEQLRGRRARTGRRVFRKRRRNLYLRFRRQPRGRSLRSVMGHGRVR